MLDKFLNEIKEKYELSEIDTLGYDGIKISGMKFNIRAYRAENFGHISLMSAKGLFGIMKMDTLIVTPIEKDLPLYSYDRMRVFGRDLLMAEMFDTLLGKFDPSPINSISAEYENLPDADAGEHWYDSIKLGGIAKKGGKKRAAVFDEFAYKHFRAFISSEAENVTDTDAKLEKSDEYVRGLLQNGGPSTDVFKKAIGQERTALLFKKVLFGTER